MRVQPTTFLEEEKNPKYIHTNIFAPEFDINSNETNQQLEGLNYRSKCTYVNHMIAKCDMEKQRIISASNDLHALIDDQTVELANICFDRKCDWKALFWRIIPESLLENAKVEK